MNYIIEWDLNLAKLIDKSFNHNDWDFIDKWGLFYNSSTNNPKYLYIHGSWNRADIFIRNKFHFSPPKIRICEVKRGDKAQFKKSVKAGTLICLSKNIDIETLEKLHKFEYDECRENHTLIPDYVKPYIIKVNDIIKLCDHE